MRQVHPASQAARGDGTAIGGHREDIGQRGGADSVDTTRPTLLGERFRRSGQLVAGDDLAAPRSRSQASSEARPVEAMTW